MKINNINKSFNGRLKVNQRNSDASRVLDTKDIAFVKKENGNESTVIGIKSKDEQYFVDYPIKTVKACLNLANSLSYTDTIDLSNKRGKAIFLSQDDNISIIEPVSGSKGQVFKNIPTINLKA